MKRNGSAAYVAGPDLKQGKGTISTGSGALKDAPYSFLARFESAPGTNPEELIGAASASCFTMAFANALTRGGTPAERVATTGTVTLEQVDGKWTISTVDLEMKAKVPGLDDAKFQQIAADAKAGCPVSRLLNAKINLTATLE